MVKEVKVNEVTNEVEVPIDLTKYEHERLTEKLELFNKNVPENKKLSFEEYIALIFETSLLEEELDSKYNYLRRLEAEVKGLEEDLVAKYSIGLEGSEEVYNEVIELRKQTLEDSIIYLKNYKLDYIKLMANTINHYSRGFSYEVEDRVITFEEVLEEDIEKNPTDVLKAIQIAKADLDPSETFYNEMLESLEVFENNIINK